MKRALSLLLILVLLFALCSCDSNVGDFGDGSYEAEYDEAGRVVHWTYFLDDGNVSVEWFCTYFESGVVKSKTYYYYEEDSLSRIGECQYSEDGLTEHISNYSADGVLLSKEYIVYEADPEESWQFELLGINYRYCEVFVYNNDGSFKWHTSYEYLDDYTHVEYEYDQEGRIIHEWFAVLNERELETVKHIYHEYGFSDDGKLIVVCIYNVSLDGTGYELINEIHYD